MHKGKRQVGPAGCSVLQTMLTKPSGAGRPSLCIVLSQRGGKRSLSWLRLLRFPSPRAVCLPRLLSWLQSRICLGWGAWGGVQGAAYSQTSLALLVAAVRSTKVAPGLSVLPVMVHQVYLVTVANCNTVLCIQESSHLCLRDERSSVGLLQTPSPGFVSVQPP